MKMNVSTIIKYLFSLIICVIVGINYQNYNIVLFGIIELFLIYLITQVIVNKNTIIGNIIGDILILLLNTNAIIYFFSNSFLNYVMMSNITSISALGNKLVIYGLAAVVMLIITFLPVKKQKISHVYLILPAFVIIYALLIFNYNDNYFPIYNYKNLINEYHKDYKMNARIKSKINGDSLVKNEYLKDSITDGYTYSKKIGELPNIILIFVEGLSSNVILDERNIMPNTKYYMNKSLNFDNYYNHTAPTYRGLIGQLYSGYQYNNNDNNNLISIQYILKNNGYNTGFINTEPNNEEFTTYLNSLGFDNVYESNVGYDDSGKELDRMLETAKELNKKEEPFFLSIYSVGTHIGWDSSDHCFDDCSSNFLNRFYNYDYYFGEFMKKFTKSELYKNTMIVFTTDHASYEDQDFKKAFKKYKRNFALLDETPFFIYHKNVEVKNIDVNGRNSLDLAPTILDYIDISDYNYFLGDSLFSNDNKSKWDYIYYAPTCYYTSKGNKVSGIPVEKQPAIDDELVKYFAAAKK